MANYVESYITLEEFKVMQLLKVPYTGFVRGIGYTYPEYFPLEIPLPNYSYWNSKPVYVQAMDTSSEAIIRSLQISTDKLASLLVHSQGNEYYFNMGNGNIIAIPINVQTNFSVNIDYSSFQLYVSLHARLKDGREINQITSCSINDILLTFNVDPLWLCSDKNETNSLSKDEKLEEPGFWEGLIPIWGSGKSAYVNFKNGNYGWGIFYVLVAASDIFLVRSIGQKILKGAWKMGSHKWPSTRKWILNHGYAKKGQPVHHWAIHQKIGKKYNIEWLINQPWNWKTFPDAASHMRYGHGVSWRGLLPGKWWEQALYGTPLWFKLSIFSSSDQLIDGGEFIYEQIKDEDYESSTGIPDIYLRP